MLLVNEENQEDVGKKNNGDVSESFKALVKAAMAAELARLKAGLGTEPPTSSGSVRSQGKQRNLKLSLPRQIPLE